MVHRGPDDEGVFIAPDIGIGVRRLSIIDIENGRQPMYSSDGRHGIVFNGDNSPLFRYNNRAYRGYFTSRSQHA